MNLQVKAMGMIAHTLGDALFDMDAQAEKIKSLEKEIVRLTKENEDIRATADRLEKERDEARAAQSMMPPGILKLPSVGGTS